MSRGQVLIADYRGHNIKVFSEVCDYLNRLQDNSRQIRYSDYIHNDKAEGLLYVGCGPPSTGCPSTTQVQVYSSDLPPLPTTRSVTKKTMTAV